MINWKSILLGTLIVATLPIFCQGYGLYEQGGQGFGNLGAFTARAEDASALFHNPAGLGLLTSSEIAISGRGLFSQSFYSNPGQSTWDSETAIDGAPSLFTNFTLGQFAVGVGSTLTHHYQLNWDEADFPARYLGNQHEVSAYEHLAGVSYRINDYLSVGATYRIAQLKMLHSRILPRSLPGDSSLAFETADRIEVDGDGSGFSFGVLYVKPRRFSFGLTYWSAITTDLSGTRSYSLYNLNDDVRARNEFDHLFGSGSRDAVTSFELPERIAVGAQTQLTVRTRLELDISSESWSTVDQLDYQTANPDGSPAVVSYPRSWKDTLSFRLAGDFQQRRALLWRAAMGSTQSVVPGESLGPDFPDYDRFMYSFGVSYTLQSKYIVELGWTYIQNRDRPVMDQELFFDPTSPDYYTGNGQDGVYETQRMQVHLGLRVLFGKQRRAPER